MPEPAEEHPRTTAEFSARFATACFSKPSWWRQYRFPSQPRGSGVRSLGATRDRRNLSEGNTPHTLKKAQRVFIALVWKSPAQEELYKKEVRLDTNRTRKIVCVVQETQQELAAGTYTIHLDINAIPSLPSGDGDKTEFEWDVRVDGNSKRLPVEGEYDVILKRTRDDDIQDTMCIKVARPHAGLHAPDYEKSKHSILNNGSAFKDAKANLGSLPDGTGFDPVEIHRKTTAADALTALVLSDAHYGFFGHGSSKTILFFDGVATTSRIRAPKTDPLEATDIILPEAKGEMKDRLFRDVSFAILTGCNPGERKSPNLVRTFLDLGCDFVFLQFFYDLFKEKKDRSMRDIAIKAAEKADKELKKKLSKDLRVEFAPGVEIKNNTPARYGDARR